MLTGLRCRAARDLSGRCRAGPAGARHVVAGHLAGLLRDDADGSPLVPPLVAGGLAAVAVLLYAAGGILLSDPRTTGGAVLRSLASLVPYCAVLATGVFPAVRALLRRLDRRL
jgi:hypothetical protein